MVAILLVYKSCNRLLASRSDLLFLPSFSASPLTTRLDSLVLRAVLITILYNFHYSTFSYIILNESLSLFASPSIAKEYISIDKLNNTLLEPYDFTGFDNF